MFETRYAESSPDPKRRVRIGARDVGDGCPVFIIAEAGVNHDGDLGKALELVDAAAETGADAVKFQAFCAQRLTTSDVRAATYQSNATGASSQRAVLSRLELSAEQFGRIADHCRDRFVMFLATPFSTADLDELFEVGIQAVKIASTDLVDFELLRHAARTNLPLIVSTGAADETEIARAMEVLELEGAGDRVALMHCVSCYPTPPDHANLAAIAALRRRFGTLAGYSDHTTSLDTGGWAVCAGACVLEKHFTLDRHADGPDHAMSLTPDELRDYVHLAREAQQALGSGELTVHPIEREVRELARKRIVAARVIKMGERIAADALTTKRADHGMSADECATIVGMTAAVTIPADTGLTREMVR